MATPVAVQIDPDELARALRMVSTSNSASTTTEALVVLLKALKVA